MAFLAISAVLFAPAAYDGFSGSPQSEPAPIEARVLAPTVREGMVAAKLSRSHLQAGDQSQPKPFAFAIPAAAVAALLIGAFFAVGLPLRRNSQAFAFFRIRVPRGPPGLQAT